MSLLLITSAAAVDAELASEFGAIPPAFLPIANRRLFAHQAALFAGQGLDLVLTLPEDFVVDPIDRAKMEALGIALLPVPPGLTLGHSVVFAVNSLAVGREPIRILHGDTLLRGLDLALGDAVSVAETSSPYHWGAVEVDAAGEITDLATENRSGQRSREVLSGYFHLADAGLLVQSITRARGSFVGGLQAYGAVRPLQAVRAAQWLDFGHVNTYYQSRQAMTTERAFNALAVTRHAVTKTSRKVHKIEAEAAWFRSLPADLKPFTPAFLGADRSGETASYSIQYLYKPSLSDLFVFGQSSPAVWEGIFAACGEFLAACQAHQPVGDVAASDLYLQKTLSRLDAFVAQADIHLDAPLRLNGAALPSLAAIARETAALIGPAPAPTIIHGDFCFSNILFDTRAQVVQAIDPRGLDGDDRPSIHGDPRYDVAKLHHSVVGRYDHILAGAFAARREGADAFALELPDSPYMRAIEAAFLATRFGRFTPAEASAHAIAIHLFLSMLPLHEDDPQRQTGLLANALRLYGALERQG